MYNMWRVIGFAFPLLLFLGVNKCSSIIKRIVIQSLERIMTIVLCTSLSFAFLLFDSVLPFLHLLDPFSEVLGALLIVFSWIIMGKFIDTIDKSHQIAKEDRNLCFLVSVVLAVAVALCFYHQGIQKDLIKLGSISLSVFIGAYFSIEKLYSDPISSPKEFLWYTINQFRNPSLSEKSFISNAITSLFTATVIFVFVCFDSDNKISSSAMDFGIGMAAGSIVVVAGVCIMDYVRTCHTR